MKIEERYIVKDEGVTYVFTSRIAAATHIARATGDKGQEQS